MLLAHAKCSGWGGRLTLRVQVYTRALLRSQTRPTHQISLPCLSRNIVIPDETKLFECAIAIWNNIIMSQSRGQTQKPLINQDAIKKKLEITNFDPNAILRGAQLTVVGGESWFNSSSIIVSVLNWQDIALRALQNPRLFTSEHYKQAAIAVAAGIGIRLAIAIPVWQTVKNQANPSLIFADLWNQDSAMGSLLCF